MREAEKKRKKLLKEIAAVRTRFGEEVNAVTPILHLAFDGTLLLVNKVGAKYLGGKPSNFIGKKITEIVPDIAQTAMDRIARAAESGTGGIFEDLIELPSGKRWFLTNAHVIKNASGEAIALEVMFVDVTNWKVAEQRADLLTKVVEQSSEGIAVTNMDGYLLFVNKAFAAMHGYIPEELPGKHLSIFHCPEQMPAVKAANKQTRQTGEFDGEIMHSRRDDSVFPAMMHNTVLLAESGEQIGMIGTLRDISDYKHAAEALRESEEKYKLIVDNAVTPIEYLGLDGKFLLINAVGARNLGGTPDDFIGKDIRVILPEMADTIMERLRQVVESESEGEFEDLVKLSSGERCFVTNFQPVKDSRGKIVAVQVISLDITERKRAEEALRESENLLQTVIDTTKDAMISIGEDGLITLFNPAAEEMFGRTRAEMTGQPVDCLMPKDYQRQHRKYVKSYFSTGKPDGVIGKVVELPGLRRDGKVFPMAISLSPGMVEGKRFVIAVLRDITERKQAVEQLRIRDKAIESSISAIAICEPGGNLIYVNPAFLKMWGYDGIEEVIGKPAAQFWQLEDFALEAREALRTKGRWTGEMFAERKDRTKFDVQIMASIVKIQAEKPVYMMASFLDVTDRKRTEKTLLASEARYRMVVEDQTELICRFTPNCILTFVNDAYCRYFGKKREELLGHNFMPLIPEEDRNEVQNQIAKLNHENPTVTTEHHVIAQDGSIRWQQWTNRAIFDEQGNIVEYQAVGRDVTSRKKAALALEHLRKFERLITDISRQFINLSSAQIDEGINQALGALGNFAEVDRSYIFQFFDEGRKTTNTHEWRAEGITPQIDNLQNLSADMAPWWMDKLAKFENIYIPDVEKLPARAKNEKQILQAQSIQSLIVIPMVHNSRLIGFVGFDSVRRQRTWSAESIAMLTIISEIFANILMRRRIQQETDSHYEKMRRAEQLASLGTVSATIAHELNQPLTVIKLFLQQGLRALKDDNDIDRVEGVIKDCIAETTKAASTVDRFRRFARKASPVYITEVDLVEVGKGIVGILAESARRRKLDLSVIVESYPPHIIGNSVELEQVFFVLIQNAIQAVDGETRQDMQITISLADNRIELTFADTCGGIEQENMDKIFEPFFTTKPANVGTGLGLCILERIVKRHGGSVHVESQVGHGTIFYISLPVGISRV